MMVNQKIILRAMMGWTAGILLGMYGGLITIIILPMNIWLKIFTVIGLFSASLGTMYSLYEVWKQLKLYSTIEQLTKDNQIECKEGLNNNANTTHAK